MKAYAFKWVLFLNARLPTSKLGNFVMAIDSFSKTSMTSSEENTKKKIIEPLLEILGWDARTNEVQLEYPIKIGSTTKPVDYALILESKPVVLVEAKPFNVKLSNDDSAQIISYGRVEDVQWVVLTNGRDLKIFDTKEGKAEKECLVVEIDLQKLPAHANNLNLISRESILSGEIESLAKRLAATKNAIRNLEQRQQEVAEEFKSILIKTIGTAFEDRAENMSKQLAEQALELFQKQVETEPEGPFEKEVRLINREELTAKPPGDVVLCPSKVEGVEFLKKYNAWGFVQMSKIHVPYFALYVGKPESSVLYFGEIESITQPLKSKEDLVKIQEKDTATFEIGKRVIHLKQGTLVKFKNPLPLENKQLAPRGLRYTTLEKLIRANHTGEL
jgi:predicted type IV restriction endonuclease